MENNLHEIMSDYMSTLQKLSHFKRSSVIYLSTVSGFSRDHHLQKTFLKEDAPWKNWELQYICLAACELQDSLFFFFFCSQGQGSYIFIYQYQSSQYEFCGRRLKLRLKNCALQVSKVATAIHSAFCQHWLVFLEYL